MDDLAIVIASCKSCDHLDNCLQSIFACHFPFTCRVVVIDDCSQDNTTRMTIDKYPSALIITNDTHQGYAASCNKGIRATDTRHILLLSPSITITDPGAITAMLHFLDRYPQAGIASCLITSENNSSHNITGFESRIAKFAGKTATSRRALHALGIPELPPPVADPHSHRIDIASNECSMIRRETLNQIGLLDERSLLCAVDLSIRAYRKGWEIYALANCHVTRQPIDESSHDQYQSIIDYHHGLLSLYRKHQSAMSATFWNATSFIDIFNNYLRLAITDKTTGDSTTHTRRRAYADLMKQFITRNKEGSSGE